MDLDGRCPRSRCRSADRAPTYIDKGNNAQPRSCGGTVDSLPSAARPGVAVRGR